MQELERLLNDSDVEVRREAVERLRGKPDEDPDSSSPESHGRPELEGQKHRYGHPDRRISRLRAIYTG